MRTHHSDLLTRLAAEDPARALPIDDAVKTDVWNALARAMAQSAPSARARTRKARRPRRAMVMAVVAVLLVVGVAFGRGLISVGSPVEAVSEFEAPSSGLGAVVPGSVQGSVPQRARSERRRPVGHSGVHHHPGRRVHPGRASRRWADRSARRGRRIRRRRAPSPASRRTRGSMTCSALAANGQIFYSVSKSDQLANGLLGPEQIPTSERRVVHELCAPAFAQSAEKSSPEKNLPSGRQRRPLLRAARTERQSVSYVLGGQERSLFLRRGRGADQIVMTPQLAGNRTLSVQERQDQCRSTEPHHRVHTATTRASYREVVAGKRAPRRIPNDTSPPKRRRRHLRPLRPSPAGSSPSAAEATKRLSASRRRWQSAACATATKSAGKIRGDAFGRQPAGVRSRSLSRSGST